MRLRLYMRPPWTQVLRGAIACSAGSPKFLSMSANMTVDVIETGHRSAKLYAERELTAVPALPQRPL